MALTFSDLHFDRFQFAAAQNINRDRFSNYITAQADKQIILMRNRLASQTHQNIANNQAAFASGAVCLESDQ
jgi:hypothetical protein